MQKKYMKFRVGDKVKFLNEKGGGIVSKVISSSLVYVATEDGFDIPVSSGDIIPMDQESKAAKMFAEDYSIDEAALKAGMETAGDEKEMQAGRIRAGAEESPGFFLAFVPADQQWFITGDLELRLINHSSFDILYNFLLENDDGSYSGRDYGSVEAGHTAVIEQIERDELAGWNNGMLQIMIHSEDGAYMPVQSTFHVKAGKFSSEGSYRETGLISEKAIMYKLAFLRECLKVTGKEQITAADPRPLETKAVEHHKETLIGKHKTGPGEAVVDLHIGEITDNIAGMSSHDMFRLQVGYFEKTLNSAIENNFRKVTFIHGIGNGVLKNAIIQKLKEYEGLENHSARLADYGQGAIDVLIHNKLI